MLEKITLFGEGTLLLECNTFRMIFTSRIIEKFSYEYIFLITKILTAQGGIFSRTRAALTHLTESSSDISSFYLEIEQYDIKDDITVSERKQLCTHYY
jgi:hypothetical protein